MRVTLFWYMVVSPFVEFPELARVTIKRSGPGSQVPKLCIYGGYGTETVTRRAA
jgi:hypothetical protein